MLLLGLLNTDAYGTLTTTFPTKFNFRNMLWGQICPEIGVERN